MTTPEIEKKILSNKRYLRNKQAEALYCLKKYKSLVKEIKINLKLIVINGYFIENDDLYTIQIKPSDRRYISKKQIYFIKF